MPGGPRIGHRGLPSSSHTRARRGDLASLTGVVEQDVLAELTAALIDEQWSSPVRSTLLFLVQGGRDDSAERALAPSPMEASPALMHTAVDPVASTDATGPAALGASFRLGRAARPENSPRPNYAELDPVRFLDAGHVRERAFSLRTCLGAPQSPRHETHRRSSSRR